MSQLSGKLRNSFEDEDEDEEDDGLKAFESYDVSHFNQRKHDRFCSQHAKNGINLSQDGDQLVE